IEKHIHTLTDYMDESLVKESAVTTRNSICESYYPYTDMKESDREDLACPYKINCAGSTFLTIPYRSHRRRHDFYLQYMLGGELNVVLPQGERILHPGEMILYYPRTHIVYTNRTRETSYLWLHYTGSDAESLTKRCNLPSHTILSVGLGDKLHGNFRLLFRELMLKQSHWQDESNAHLIRILTDFARAVHLRGSGGKSVYPAQLSASLLWMHAHFHEKFPLNILSNMENLSESRYRALFTHWTGMPPSEYLSTLRIRRACELFLTTEMSVSAVAEECGYPDPLYFSRIFKKKMGVSPRAYKHN
ncbi:MAG TPA: hypothetical protein DER23_01460, partial [Clostridiales bacterium]|nr:hypothetical protein [Clostridiales bacterium]